MIHRKPAARRAEAESWLNDPVYVERREGGAGWRIPYHESRACDRADGPLAAFERDRVADDVRFYRPCSCVSESELGDS